MLRGVRGRPEIPAALATCGFMAFYVLSNRGEGVYSTAQYAMAAKQGNSARKSSQSRTPGKLGALATGPVHWAGCYFNSELISNTRAQLKIAPCWSPPLSSPHYHARPSCEVLHAPPTA